MARYIAFAVVVTLVASTAGIVLYRHFSMRTTLEESARRFTELISLPLTQIADMYGGLGMEDPIHTQITGLLEFNQDVERVDIVRANGRVAFTATPGSVRDWRDDPSTPTIERVAAVGAGSGTETIAERIKTDGRLVFRVLVPGSQPDNPSFYSVVATFTYDSLYQQLNRALVVAVLGLGLGLVITYRVSGILARGITRGLEELQSGVRRIRSGDLGERVRVSSGDEIEELAEGFNEMSDQLEQTIERLRSANLELQTLDQMKADLVANVSHELRTPLTALKGYLELLHAGDLGGLGGEARRAVEVCRRNVARLGLRVEDLVQMSHMEKVWPSSVPVEPVDLRSMIPLVAEVFEMRIRDKALTVEVETSSDLPLIYGSAEQIERVILNLVDNAVKFTPDSGSITVAAEGCDHDGRHGVLIRIIDTGIGIPEAELVRVFDRFYQVDSSIRRRFGGMGLGLSLVQRIVEAHRGIVWAESGETIGTVFSVWLPRRPLEDLG
jgi:signal transduction histidine kinase